MTLEEQSNASEAASQALQDAIEAAVAERLGLIGVEHSITGDWVLAVETRLPNEDDPIGTATVMMLSRSTTTCKTIFQLSAKVAQDTMEHLQSGECND